MNQSTIKKLSLGILATLCCGAVFAGPLKAPSWNHMMIPMRPAQDTITAGGPIYSNLATDACTSCNYDASNGYLIIGPTNCYLPGSTQWLAYPFYAARTAVPRQASVAVTLDADLCSNGANKFTVAIYDDACAGPNNLLMSGVATAPAAPCALATVRFRTTTSLTAGQKYWIVCSTAAGTQDSFTGVWWESNYAPFYVNFNDGNGWQFDAPASPGGFMIQ
jgi:hypothetical protein